MLAIITTGMSLGFSASASCTAVCFPILLPYLASDTNTRLLQGLKTVLLFSLGRISAYMVLGMIVAFIIGSVDLSPLLVPVVTVCLSLILIIYGLHTLGAFNTSNQPVARACQGITRRRPHFLMGILVGSRPCIPLLAALLYSTSLSGVGQVMLFMLFFGLASSLLIIAFGVAGRGFLNLLANKISLERIRRLSGLVLVIMGVVFLLQGIAALINI